MSPTCQHRIRLIRPKKAPTEFLKVDEGAMRLRIPLSCVRHPRTTETVHTDVHTRTVPHICVSGFYWSWCSIMPVVRAAAYLYELSSRRLKWSEPYPPTSLSLGLVVTQYRTGAAAKR